MTLPLDELFAVLAIACLVAGAAFYLSLRRYRRMRQATQRFERERALERDAIRLASAKLKFRNILARQGQPATVDPLRDLYGVDVPTDCRIG